jgi:hypothetical protein
MIEHAALQVSLARVWLVAVHGQNFHYCQKKVPLEQKAVPAKNEIHVFPTIFTSAAGFLLASCDKKVTYVTQRFFWRQREVTPVVYVRDSTRVHPSVPGRTQRRICDLFFVRVFLICTTVTAKSVTSYQVRVPDTPPLLSYNSTIPPQTSPPHPSHHHFLPSCI